MKFSNISFLKNARDIQEITEGHSDAKKYSFRKDDKSYFLKIGNFKIHENLEDLLNWAEIPHPKIIEWGKYDQKNNYIIEELSDGTNFKYMMDKYESKFIYEFAFKIGKQYGNLRKKYEDKHVTTSFLEEYKEKTQTRILELKDELKKHKKNIPDRQYFFIKYLIAYLEDNFDLMKKGICPYGHCDIKPSNFLLYKKDLIATDFEHTDNKELSYSMISSYARNTKEHEKHISFTRGYLDGLFNLDVPFQALSSFNYTFMFNMAHYCKEFLKREKYDKLSDLIDDIQKNYIKDGKVIVDERIRSDAHIDNFPNLKGYDFSLVEGSFDGNNLTFKCSKEGENLFLKIMNMSKNKFDRVLRTYELLKEDGIHIPSVRNFGEIQKDKSYYVVFDFIAGESLKKSCNLTSFADGFKYGTVVAKYFKTLESKNCDFLETFDAAKLYKDINRHSDEIYKYKDWYLYLKWPKEKLQGYIDKYIKCFEGEPLKIVHRDLKFGNILVDSKKEIYFVDNESFTYSYDMMNFLYNIHDGFRPEETNDAYRGYVNGYLKYMNDGAIPERIEGQAKLLLIYFLMRTIVNFLKKIGKIDNIELFMQLCEEYIEGDKEIEWLK